MNDKLPLKIIFLNVQHGDGIIVLLPHEKTYESAMIIDCNDGRKAYKVLKEYNIKLVEAIVISHFHSDHYRGFDILLNKLKEEKIKMKNIYYYPDKVYRETKEEKTYKSFLAKIVQLVNNNDFVSNSNVIDGNKKEKVIYIDENLKISIIYPRNIDITGENKINNYSGIVDIEYKKNKILLTGDLEDGGWFKLYNYMKRYQNQDCLNVDLIKMPHHGAFYETQKKKTLGTKEILEFVKPDYAIISTAENRKYQHPNINTIMELRRKSIKILCTNSTKICKKECECFGDIVVDIDENIIIKDYNIKSQNLYCIKNIKIKLD